MFYDFILYFDIVLIVGRIYFYPIKTNFFWFQFSAAAHPLGIMYCKSLLAAKLVKQGEEVVRSQPKDAFTVAAVVTALW